MDPGDGRGDDRLQLQVRIATRESDTLKIRTKFWFSGGGIGENRAFSALRAPGERICCERTNQEPV